MKRGVKNRFRLSLLMAVLGLMPSVRVAAQNYTAWPVTQIAAGGNHTLFTKSDGSLWVMGDNSYGQLGLGPMPAMTNVPHQIVSNGVLLLSAGYQHSLFKRSDGSLWGMGDNSYGQLGLGSPPTNANVPQQIMSSGVGLIAAGYYHSLFTGGGPPHLWAMGENADGQLGDGTFANHYVPEGGIHSHRHPGGFHGHCRRRRPQPFWNNQHPGWAPSGAWVITLTGSWNMVSAPTGPR